jgi:CheY-like chemotaxis protein
VSGYVDLYDIEKLKAVGFDNYLMKPIKVEIIQAAIEEGLKRLQT